MFFKRRIAQWLGILLWSIYSDFDFGLVPPPHMLVVSLLCILAFLFLFVPVPPLHNMLVISLLCIQAFVFFRLFWSSNLHGVYDGGAATSVHFTEGIINVKWRQWVSFHLGLGQDLGLTWTGYIQLIFALKMNSYPFLSLKSQSKLWINRLGLAGSVGRVN